MDYAESFAQMINEGVDSLWRNVAAMPADKLDWRPAPDARTARELLEEITSVTPYSTILIRTMKVPDMPETQAPADLAAMEAAYRADVKDLIAAVREFPADKLQETLEMPWGMTMSFKQTIDYPYWNLMYHYGQIAYIQTLYGDKEMH